MEVPTRSAPSGFVVSPMKRAGFLARRDAVAVIAFCARDLETLEETPRRSR
jgi:hypothetical protein